MIELQRLEGGVFLLRMAGGENRLNRGLLDELDRALDEVEASQGDAALVTAGAGRFFSTGLDLEWLATSAPDLARAFLSDLHHLFARLLAFPMATVAALNGHAFAGGAMLALAHDFRVMRSDRGYFCLPEIDLRTGLPLTPGMYALLSARLPPATLHEAVVTGRRYGGPEAAGRQIVHEAVPDSEVLPRAIELARGLAEKDRASMAALKRGLFAAALAALSQPTPDWVARD